MEFLAEENRLMQKVYLAITLSKIRLDIDDIPQGGGGGVLGISSDGDDRMEPKDKTQKNP